MEASKMKRLTGAQKKGRRMRAKGRDYRGGYTREQIAAGEHRKHACRVRGCTARIPLDEFECKRHRDDGDD